MDNANIHTGIQYFKSGNKIGARQVFLEILKQEPNNEIAWLWLAACVEKSEQKRDCFHKVLSINPNNQNAQKALAELEMQISSDARQIPQSGTILKCPSCGSIMGKPDHTGLVQCGYCGTTITYHPPVEKVEKKNIERYLEICKAALEGSNYDEAIQYANRILEIEPENFDAWINKAIATFWLTTEANNRFDEAMGYLLRAEKTDKDNPIIQNTRVWLMENQCRWYTYLGDQADALLGKIMDIYDSPEDALFGHPEAKAKCQEYVIRAMNYYLLASNYNPNDYTPLYKMRNLANFGNWINWPTEVRNKISILQKDEQKNHAMKRLLDSQKQLQESQAKLEKLKKEKGLFVGMKIENLKSNIKSLKQQITKYEKTINSL